MLDVLGRRVLDRIKSLSTGQSTPAPFANGTLQRRSAAVLIHVPTSDGSGEACHPSVVESAQKLGGFRFWMANTPYPGNSHKLENPEIYASSDGLFWQVPPGLSNPVVRAPPGGDRRYHSDPCLIIHGKEFWLYFRTTDEAAAPRCDWIKLTTSKDGVTWTDPVPVLRDQKGALLLSPSVVFTGDLFLMWTVDAAPGDGRLALTCRASTNGYDWSDARRCTINWLGGEMEPWHIEVRKIGDAFAMVMSARTPGQPGSQRWYRARGDGTHWYARPAADLIPCAFEAGKPYKASWLPPVPGRPFGWTYTSSRSADGTWFTALRRDAEEAI